MDQTKKVIKARQRILGFQNSITDRTIRLSGIPPELRTERALKETIESLGIGKIKKIVICKEWKKLDHLFKQRDKVLHKLEIYWARYLGNKNNDVFNIRPFASGSYPLTRNTNINHTNRYHDDENAIDNTIDSTLDVEAQASGSSTPILEPRNMTLTSVEPEPASSISSLSSSGVPNGAQLILDKTQTVLVQPLTVKDLKSN
ncbi:unnamed protein product [Ambrosiozyma monospora]|uniref:Unnamed protein product n=1 Tax=Ambrosiozyma monospora TaxID=43982 RepID=A0ACB5UBN4_AMBMO|nr:unnamed protein product [Ambrosiozyma monospora]